MRAKHGFLVVAAICAMAPVAAAQNIPVVRARDYDVTIPEDSASVTVTLDSALYQNYFVIVRGSSDAADPEPEDDYVRVSKDPYGNFASSTGSDDQIEVTRGCTTTACDGDWVGTVTVVESTQAEGDADAFNLVEVLTISHGTGTSGTTNMAGAGWGTLGQVVPIGGYAGAGCSSPSQTRADHDDCHVKLVAQAPGGTEQIAWSRSSTATGAATSVVYVIEWGTNWSVEGANVTGTADGNSTPPDTSGEYNTAAISSSDPDSTWVWGSGFTGFVAASDGRGETAEGQIWAIGDGVAFAQPASAVTTVAASAYARFDRNRDLQLYRMSHAGLVVDWRFQTMTSTDLSTTVDVTDRADDAWFAVCSTGVSNNTQAFLFNDAIMFPAKDTGSDDQITVHRNAAASAGAVWCQAVGFEGILSRARVEDVRAYDGGVVEWVTSTEEGTVGFHLWRRGPAGWQRVTARLVAGLGARGGTYRVVDAGAVPGVAYDYAVEELEVGGRTHRVERTLVAAGVAPAWDGTILEGVGRVARPEPAALRFRRWLRKLAMPAAASTGPAAPSAVTRGKIRVRETGLYRVTAAEVAASLGVPSAWARPFIAKGWVSLERRGKAVAYLPGPGGDGLYFYADAPADADLAEDVLWLQAGHGLIMGRTSRPAGPGTAATAILDTVTAEEDVQPATALFSDPAADVFVWASLVGGTGPRDFAVWADDVMPGAATLTVHVVGATEGAHRLRVTLDGAPLGSVELGGRGPREVTLAVADGLLLEGENAFAVEALAVPGADSVIMVDRLTLRYPRALRAPAGAPGFTVLDVSRADGPRVVDGVAVVAGRARFAAEPGHRYHATTLAHVLRPSVTVRTIPGAPPAGVDWLAVAPAALRPAAEALAAHRQAQGLSTAVVDLEAVEDAFAHGLRRASAVEDLVAVVQPRYVVLVGDGTYDRRGVTSSGDNLVPAPLVSTARGLVAADGVAGVAVGRLPVHTPAEAMAVVAKIIAFEADGGAWRQDVALFADNRDAGADFAADARSLAVGLAPVFSLADHAPDAARAAWRSALGGSGVVAYVGHAGMDRLSTALWSSADVGDLAGPRASIVVGLTCLVGRFDVPGFDGVGEELLLAPVGGAVAVWAPAGLSLHHENVRVGRALLAALPGADRLGDAIQAAGASFQLLGDPALRLR